MALGKVTGEAALATLTLAAGSQDSGGPPEGSRRAVPGARPGSPPGPGQLSGGSSLATILRAACPHVHLSRISAAAARPFAAASSRFSKT